MLELIANIPAVYCGFSKVSMHDVGQKTIVAGTIPI
jgi:hypothetical protein